MAKPYVPYDGPIVSREEARLAGSKRYFTGIPCIRGHLFQRQVSSGICLICARANVIKAFYANPEPARARARKAYFLHPEMGKARHSVWVKANRDKEREYGRRWRAKNLEHWRLLVACNHKRRGMAGGHFTPYDIYEILASQKAKCAYCQVSIKREYTIDHIVPVSKGGTNDRRNLQLVCRPCNSSKHDHMPEEFARRRGLLL